MLGVDVVVRPVDARRFAVPLAAGIQFERMLALVDEPFELPHLSRQLGLEMAVLDIQAIAFARGSQIASIIGPLGQWIAEEHEIGRLLVGRDVGHEHDLAAALFGFPRLGVNLAGNLRPACSCRDRHAPRAARE